MNANDSDNMLMLDPDAPLRQKMGRAVTVLAEADRANDRALARYIYYTLRAGRLHEGISACKDADQRWRIASLMGGVRFKSAAEALQEDLDVFNRDLGDDYYVSKGNKYKKRWQKMCRALAKASSDDFERATYALLAGDIDGALPVCKTWEDYMHAYVNAITEETMFEKQQLEEQNGVDIDMDQGHIAEEMLKSTRCKLQKALDLLSKSDKIFIR